MTEKKTVLLSYIFERLFLIMLDRDYRQHNLVLEPLCGVTYFCYWLWSNFDQT